MYIIMDKVNNTTQQNKPINYVIKIKREIRNNVNKNVVKLSLIHI